MDKVYKKAVIVSVTRHRQNPLDSIFWFYFTLRLQTINLFYSQHFVPRVNQQSLL
jgi:hypothetical protein